MAIDSDKWDVEDGHPEVEMCYGCGTVIEEFDAIQCEACGELFCSEACRDKHECLPQVGPIGD